MNISTTYLPKASNPDRRSRAAALPSPMTATKATREQGDQGGMEDFFQRFFGNPFGRWCSPEMPQRKGYALGSGVVVDRAGYILTNNHVVDKADRIQVKFIGDTTEYDAKVVGVDAPTDLAVIRDRGHVQFDAGAHR